MKKFVFAQDNGVEIRSKEGMLEEFLDEFYIELYTLLFDRMLIGEYGTFEFKDGKSRVIFRSIDWS